DRVVANASFNPSPHWVACVAAKELNPRRRVDDHHSSTGWSRISSRLPSQPVPAMASASSIENGTTTSWRSAKFTASRFVVNPYCRITAAHASSSMSMLVRAIHQGYTSTSPALPDRRQLRRYEHEVAADD